MASKNNPNFSLSSREVFLWFSLALSVAFIQMLLTLNSGGDKIGSDYSYFIPRLIDGLIFFKNQGLTIPWYTPSFCGGVPFFPDPQSLFFSLPQILSLIVSPWTAIQLTALCMLLCGALSMWLLCRKIFNFNNIASLCAVFAILGNGFLLSRMTVGHLSYHSYPLILTFAAITLSKRLPDYICVSISALIFSYFIHSGFYIFPVLLPISVLLIFLVLQLTNQTSEKIGFSLFFIRTLFSFTLGLIISSPKVMSSLMFMNEFPRPKSFDNLDSLLEAALLIINNLITPAFYPFSDWADWEYNYRLSPLIVIPFAAGIYTLFKTIKSLPDRTKNILILTCLSLLLLFTLILTTGLWSMADILKRLWFFSSLRINMRVSAALVFFIILLAAYGINKFSSAKNTRFILISMLLSCFIPGETIRYTLGNNQHIHESYYNFPISEANQLYKTALKKQPDKLKIQYVKNSTDYRQYLTIRKQDWPFFSEIPKADDLIYMQANTSNANCYFPYFSDYPYKLNDGNPESLQGVEFNFINPSCYVFPSANNCKPGDKVLSFDLINLQLLLSRNNPNWELPYSIKSSLFASKLLFCICILLILAYYLNKFSKLMRNSYRKD